MLVKNGASARIRQGFTRNKYICEIKTGTETAVKDQQYHRRYQYREREQSKHSGQEQRPGSEWHLGHGHYLGTHVQNSADVVDTAQQLGNNKQEYNDEPKGHSQTRAGDGLWKGN